MIKTIARGAYLLFLVGMLAAYAFAPAKGEVQDPNNKEPIWIAFA
jgi:hypothetical protein